MKVIAILCSDLHLSENAPVARSAEKCWFSAMNRPLYEIKRLSQKYDAPVIVAGDIFDKWKCNPSIINFALDNLPDNSYCIPGQHDLPFHSIDEIEKSAYWTLVKAEKIVNLDTSYGTSIDDNGTAWMYPFPWGIEIEPMEEEDEAAIKIAVIHKYIWKLGHSYPGADEDSNFSSFRSKLKGYNSVVVGDNHSGFTVGGTRRQPHLINCGTLMRRKIDEISYKPQVGLLHDDGTITPHHLDTSQDKFIDIEEAKMKEQQEIDTSKFLNELKSLGSDSLDFRDAANKYMDSNKISNDIRKLVLESME